MRARARRARGRDVGVVTGSRIAILGGHGKTGLAVGRALLSRRQTPVAIGRADWPDLAGALAGCTTAYVLAPNMHADESGYVSVVMQAARAAGVQRLVYHSVAAPYAPAMPHHWGKARAEDLIRRGGLPWTILQPGAYLQNLPLDGSTIEVPYRADAPFGFAHLDDVAQVAATVLVDGGHDGATYELASIRATVAEVAAAAGADLRVVDPEDWARSHAADQDARVTAWLLAMFVYYDRYGLPVGTLPMAALLGRRPTDLTAAVS